MWKRFTDLLLFGNYFYGCCAVALAIETNLQLGLTLNHPAFYIALFCGSVVYYTYAYINEHYVDVQNARALWYYHHAHFIRGSQWTLGITGVVCTAYLLFRYGSALVHLPVGYWGLVFLFPVVAALYYDIPLFRPLRLNLRRTGWMKPFVIGFVWTGAVAIYPLIWHAAEAGLWKISPYHIAWFSLKNWMFITVLCIMFDIKDYASDSNKQLKTFVVRVGLRKTLFFIIIPLTVLGLFSFFCFAALNHFPAGRIVANTIPFVWMVWVGWSLHERKNILYYLAVIDGLMMVKAICGIIGITLIKI
ncbi:UbiA prenyltransferase family protein [Filimonas effusa]|uniref:Prenyltransferase n=1 Tax=Filimonas effusa TaxID=2508721 RepID=A0A4Q1DAM6_9BACT|nr:hypothetical protein [Filimonas effusa]RXK85958.1 hypothetical protein ESB13_03875 [Filimonas effusa]